MSKSEQIFLQQEKNFNEALQKAIVFFKIPQIVYVTTLALIQLGPNKC